MKNYYFFILFTVLIIYVSCTSKGSSGNIDEQIDEINFCDITDTIDKFRPLKYGRQANQMYKWSSSYLKELKDNYSITDGEYDIQINAVRNLYGIKLNDAIKSVIEPGDQCRNKHKLLNELHGKLRKLIVNKSMNHDLLVQLNANSDKIFLHQKILNVANSTQKDYEISGQITDVEYDYKYPQEQLSKIKDLLAKYPHNCQAVKSSLATVKYRLNERHKKYLQSLVDLYLTQEEYDYDIDTKVTAEIDKYYYSGGASEWAVKYGISEAVARLFTDDLVRRMIELKNKNNTSDE